MAFTFGSDPEFMLVSGEKHKSAIGVLPEKDRAISESGHRFYYDNVLAEVGLKPAESKEEAVENVREALTTLAKIVSPYKLVLQSAQNYPKAELQHKHATVAGCKAEWCAYRLSSILPPAEIIEKTPFRTAGGHVHLGSETGPLQDGMNVMFVVRMLDLFLAVPSLFLDPDKTAKERRKIYGTAGTHRLPEYGVEYRPLSNFWYRSPQHVRLIYDLCEFTLRFVQDDMHQKFWSVNEDLLDEDDPSVAYTCFGYDVESLKMCINTCDKKLGKKFMLFVNNFLPNRLAKNIEMLALDDQGNFYETWGIK